MQAKVKYNYKAYPLLHADANTIHSLQGSTKECTVLINTHLRKGFSSLSSAAFYVALSRATAFKNIFFAEPWTLKALSKWKPEPWMLKLQDSLDRRHDLTVAKYFPNE